MGNLRSLVGLFFLLLICSSTATVSARGSRKRSGFKWLTLGGDPPLVIARGGYSGLLPDSSYSSYVLAQLTGSSQLHMWCDVQLTKDGVGFCFPDINMQNASNIDYVYKNRKSTYVVNGVTMQGWFSVDFTFEELLKISLTQGIFTRPSNYDHSKFQIIRVEDLARQLQQPGLWLNIQHDAFFGQHKLDTKKFLLSLSKNVVINYVSSPEVAFLRNMASQLKKGTTTFIFRCLELDNVEPSTNLTYGVLLRNLTLIKTFASGILVPKTFIWPVDMEQYLQNHTYLVLDAHAAGLKVFASDFANDVILPYDYSYDPVAEYLNFVDNGKFSVDGVLSDFPLTPLVSIDCFSHMGTNETIRAFDTEKVLVISSEGASGDYPGCTDKAYAKAVADGAEILDCPVQMSNDGIPFCLGDIDLRERTNVAESNFSSMATDNPDLNITSGIFTYNLTWSQIQSLKPAIFNPYSKKYALYRNPKARNEGHFMTLSEFLEFTKNASSISGILIGIQNAAYLAEKQGLGVADAVQDALSKAGYNNNNNQTTKKIMIRSTDSAVLLKFKSIANYDLVYDVRQNISQVLNSTISKMKEFATSISGFRVYVRTFGNEYVSQPWDFFSDPYVEIHNHVRGAKIDGVIADFPRTAARYKRNHCLSYKNEPNYMTLYKPGGLIPWMSDDAMPPAEAPNPILGGEDVAEPPLPPASPKSPPTGNGSTAPGPVPRNGLPRLVVSSIFNAMVAVVVALLLW